MWVSFPKCMTHIDLTNERVSIRESVRKRVLLALLLWLKVERFPVFYPKILDAIRASYIIFPTRYFNCRLNNYQVFTGGSLVTIVDFVFRRVLNEIF